MAAFDITCHIVLINVVAIKQMRFSFFDCFSLLRNVSLNIRTQFLLYSIEKLLGMGSYLGSWTSSYVVFYFFPISSEHIHGYTLVMLKKLYLQWTSHVLPLTIFQLFYCQIQSPIRRLVQDSFEVAVEKGYPWG